MTLLPAEGGRGARHVLVTDGGRGQSRSALAAVRALAAAGYVPSVTVSARHSLAGASRYVRAQVPIPRGGSRAYAEALARERATDRYFGILPASDLAVAALCAPGHQFLCKEALAAKATALGIPVPLHQTFQGVAAARAAAGDFAYPVVIKPSTSRFPAVCATHAGDLAALDEDAGPVLVQEYVAGPMRAVSGVVWEGRLVAACHQRYLRTWPVEAGTSCAAETTAPDVETEERLLSLFDGYSGIFQAQFVDGRLIDLNPRVYGSLPLAVAAGVNLPAILCDLARGARVKPSRARSGVAYRWLEGDLRHVAAALRRRRLSMAAAAGALLPRRGSAHSVWSLRDPAPALARARYAASVARGAARESR